MTRYFMAALLALAILAPGLSSPARACEGAMVTLAPSLTELAFEAGAGDCLVGVVAWSDHPAEAGELPEIGDAFQFDLEKILSLGADTVLAWKGGTPPAAVRRMEEMGLEAAWIEIRALEEIAPALEAIGRAAGREDRAEAAADSFREGLARRLDQRRMHANPIRVFYQISPRPLYTFGGRHVVNEMIRACGGENVFSRMDQEAFVVDLEAVLAADPEIILAAEEQGVDDPLTRWREFSGLTAVSEERLERVDASSLVRPSSGALEGMDKLCRLLDPIRD